MLRLTPFVRLTLFAGAFALVGCPGNAPQLDPKFLTGGSGGGLSGGTAGTGGAPSGGTGGALSGGTAGTGGAQSGGTAGAGGETGSGGQTGCVPKPVPGVCARGADGVRCALSDGVSALKASSVWEPEMSDAMGWAFPQNYETIAFPDLDGDGRPDLCGRAYDGLRCALGTGTEFGKLSVWAHNFQDSDGWSNPDYYRTLRYADLNADGKDDVCARAGNGVFCWLSNGADFFGPTLWLSLSAEVDWFVPAGYTTFQLPDLDHDGKADLCVRGHAGLMCALSNGAAFGSLDLWSDTFSDDNGWTNVDQYATLRFPDLNGDGKADVCGRGSDGVRCALSSGTTYGPATVWTGQLSNANTWNVPQYYETIDYADVDGDGSDDLCARAKDGEYCALSKGTSFGTVTLWSSQLSDANGWSPEAYYSTLRLPDLDGDGKADLCGRSAFGMVCGLSNGKGFTITMWSPDFGDAQGFNPPSSYKTLQTPVLEPGMCP